jgi:hypothetical protein
MSVSVSGLLLLLPLLLLLLLFPALFPALEGNAPGIDIDKKPGLMPPMPREL